MTCTDGHSPNPEINAILQAPDRLKLLDWMQHQPLAHWSAEHQFLMVHAGVVPQWTLEQTLSCAAEVERVILTRIRYCDRNGKILTSASGPPGSQPPPYRPWFKHKHRKTRKITIAFGHWAALGLHLKKRLLGLDSGCVWGGRLSAIRLEDRKVFQVPGLFR